MLESVSPFDLAEEIQQLHADGLPPGASTGWPDVDKYFTVGRGFWTVVTGVPSHGKSTWCDNLMLNLINQGWKFVVYSPESQPNALYLALLIEKLKRRPFRKGYHNRLEASDIASGISELDNSLRLLRMGDQPVFPCLQDVMDLTDEAVLAAGWADEKIGVLVDPWNQLDHAPVLGMNETQMISHELMVWRQWVRTRNVHGFIVAHPQKPQRNKDGEFRPVGLYDINGSAAWYNQCDQGIIITRMDDNVTEINIEKVRFRHLGMKGITTLRYEPGTGTFYDAFNAGNRYGLVDEQEHSEF